MAEIVTSGESIEGRRISGISRKPIEYKGIILEKGVKLHKFVSRFNTKACIDQCLENDDNMIEESAHVSMDDELICDNALLRSYTKKYTSKLIANASSTHGASAWDLPRQTNVKIIKSHLEIENAILKRQTPKKLE